MLNNNEHKHVLEGSNVDAARTVREAPMRLHTMRVGQTGADVTIHARATPRFMTSPQAWYITNRITIVSSYWLPTCGLLSLKVGTGRFQVEVVLMSWQVFQGASVLCRWDLQFVVFVIFNVNCPSLSIIMCGGRSSV